MVQFFKNRPAANRTTQKVLVEIADQVNADELEASEINVERGASSRKGNPLSYGGELRNRRMGRARRPLSVATPIHLVFKANRDCIPGGFRTLRRFQLLHAMLQQYAIRFAVKVEQTSIQGDHVHLVVRAKHRSRFQSFLRVFSGQVAQRFESEGLSRRVNRAQVTDTPNGVVVSKSASIRRLWMFRPFTRIVLGRRAYKTVRDYVQLNEKEALGDIPYRKTRLRGLLPEERKRLWS